MVQKNPLVASVKARMRGVNGLVVLTELFDLVMPCVVIHLTGVFLAGRLSLQAVVFDGAILFGAFCARAWCQFRATRLAHRMAYETLSHLRLSLVDRLRRLPLGFFQQRSTGELSQVVEHDVEQIEVYLAHVLPSMTAAFALPVLALLGLLILDWRLALAMVYPLPLVLLIHCLAAPAWKRGFKVVMESMKQMQSQVVEYVRNIRVIKAFSREESKTEQTIQAARDYVKWVVGSMGTVTIPMGLIAFVMKSGVVLLLIMGNRVVVEQELRVSWFILAMILGVSFTSSVVRSATFQHFSVVFHQAMSSIASVAEAPLLPEPVETEMPTDYSIVFEDVGFTYLGDEQALKNLNLVITAGETTALVGPSGGGKTTITQLIQRFWLPQQGRITIGGVSVRDLREDQISSLVSVVQQESFLFCGTIAENIALGRPGASREEMEEAARRARIHDFIMALPKGGATLSGGERQRLSIARMILKDAPIVILDEATSSLDRENKRQVEQALAELCREKTVLLITHCLAEAQRCHMIVVVDSGQVVARGQHDELLVQCYCYRKFVEAQHQVEQWQMGARA